MSTNPTADRPAGCIVVLTPGRADLVFRALCMFLVSGQAKPGDRAELADLVELLSDGESFERGAA
jgi:hypothetical protein